MDGLGDFFLKLWTGWFSENGGGQKGTTCSGWYLFSCSLTFANLRYLHLFDIQPSICLGLAVCAEFALLPLCLIAMVLLLHSCSYKTALETNNTTDLCTFFASPSQ